MDDHLALSPEKEHARYFPTSLEMCVGDHFALTPEKIQQKQFQRKPYEQCCSTHGILPALQKNTVLSHLKFPPDKETVPPFPGNQSLQGKETPDKEAVPPFQGNQFLQGKETLDGETISSFLGNLILQGKEKTSTYTRTPLSGEFQFLQGKEKTSTYTRTPVSREFQFLQGKERTSAHPHTPLPGEFQSLQGKEKVNTLGADQKQEVRTQKQKARNRDQNTAKTFDSSSSTHKSEKKYVELTPGTPVWVQHRQNTTWEPATVISQCTPNLWGNKTVIT